MAGKAVYEIQVGNEIIKFEGPDGLSDSQIEDIADKQLRTAKPGQTFQHSQFVGKTEAPAHGADESSAIGSFIRSIPKAATFNFDDEIRSAANAAIPGSAAYENFAGLSGGHQQGPGEGDFWSRFKTNMGDYRAQAEADQALHPTASFLGEMAGVIPTVAGAAETAAARIPAAATAFMKSHPFLTASGVGGISSALSGAGAGEGNRGQSAAIGALTGAAFGPALIGASELLPAIARYGKIFFNKASHTEAVQQIIKALQRDGFDVTSPTGVVKLKSALQEFSGKPVAIADIGRATRSRTALGMGTPSDVQQASIDSVLQRQAGQGARLAGDVRATVAPRTDIHALDDALVAQREEQAKALREAAMFAQGRAPKGILKSKAVFDDDELGQVHSFTYIPDKDGPSITGTVAYHPSMPEEAQLTIHPSGGDGGEWSEGVGRLGPSGVRDLLSQLKTKFPEVENFVGERVSGARKAAGVTGGVEVPTSKIPTTIPGGRQSIMVDDPQLQQLAQLPITKRAREAAYNQAENERGILASQGQDISHIPDLNDEDLDMRGFDYIKRFLDQQVSGLYKGDTGTFTKAELGNVKSLRDAIRGRLRKVQPDGSIGAEDGPYAKYLDAYRGSSEMIDSLREGPNFLKLPPEKIISEQAGRSEAGRELYRTGAARKLTDVLGDTKHTQLPANRILQSDNELKQLQALGIAPSDAAQLQRSVEQERIFNLLPREAESANKEARSAARADANYGLDHLVPIIPGNPIAWASMMGRKAFRHVSTARNAAVNAEALPRLLETNPQAVEGIISELELQGKLDQARVLRRKLRAIQGSGVGGTIIGGPVSLPTLED